MAWWVIILGILVHVAAAVLVADMAWDYLGPRLRDRKRRRQDSDHVCSVCYAELTVGECWERRDHLANTEDMGPAGGTYLTGYYCARHRPLDAVRFTG